MNILQIPFVEKTGIQRDSEGALALTFNDSIHNHLQTIHASAQFTLAETASGEFLQNKYPDLAGKVIPLLRESQAKFKKPATNSIAAYASVTSEASEKFNIQFQKKGRASLPVYVEIKDTEDTVTFTGTFTWFIQRVEE